MLTNSDIRIINLEPMRIAFVKSKSATPELDSWKVIKDFIDKNNLNENLDQHPIYGIYDPYIETNGENHEYECWIKVENEREYGLTEGIEIRNFNGGKFAVTTSNLDDIDEGSTSEWNKLKEWAKSHGHNIADGPHLERPLNSDLSERRMNLDLYLALD